MVRLIGADRISHTVELLPRSFHSETPPRRLRVHRLRPHLSHLKSLSTLFEGRQVWSRMASKMVSELLAEAIPLLKLRN